jgi:hypothetical protein
MNREEAIQIVEEWLAKFRSEPYAVMVTRIDGDRLGEEITRGSTWYQLKLLCVWDSIPEGDVRVIASIDDGGFRAFFPLNRSFIKRSDESFVDE